MSDRLPDDDPEQAKAFLACWVIFRKILEFNGVHHREAYAAIGAALAEVPGPFSLLDLGAGDGEWTVGVLTGKPVAHYRAVDFSATALQLAEEYAAALPGVKSFVRADFSDYARESEEPFDVVLIGLNLHHLPFAEKHALMPRLRRLVAPGGRLIIHEAIARPGETRDDTLLRWWEAIRVRWSALDPDELERAREHAFAHDHAESVATYEGLFLDAGFRESRVLFTDPDELYAVIEARA